MQKRRRSVAILGLALSLVIFVSLSVGTVVAENSGYGSRQYYVNSRTGSDAGSGSREEPWRSLRRLGDVTFHPGDIIFFAAESRFEGGFEINQSGTSNAPIVITRYGEGPPPRFTNPRSAALDGNGIRVNGSYVIVDGLYFEKCPVNPVATDIHLLGAVFLTTNANYCVVRNCEMTQTPMGITVYGQHNLITKNCIHDNNAPIQPHWGPIGIVVCTSSNEVSYNRVVNYCAPSAEYGHDGGAIEINDRAFPKENILIHHNLSLRNQGFIEWVGHVTQDNFVIHHNVCMDYQSFLGFTGPCTNMRVENNTVVRTLAHRKDDSEDVVFWDYFDNTNITFLNNIFVYDGARVEPVFSRGELSHAYNLFYRIDEEKLRNQPNEKAYQRKYLGGGAHLRTGDKIGNPLFKNLAKGDFRLTAGSPAIGAGTILGYEIDFDDQPIPKGAPSIGAFEFNSRLRRR
ncbi:MAG: chondroitinase-B domain-containing protein [Limisphaerales bacterium]